MLEAVLPLMPRELHVPYSGFLSYHNEVRKLARVVKQVAANGANVLALALRDRARAVDREVCATRRAAADAADAVTADGRDAVGAVLDRRVLRAAAREARRRRREIVQANGAGEAGL